MSRVAVTGSRHCRDREHVFAVLDAFHARTPITVLLEGECPIGHGGVDKICRAWAEANGIHVEPYPPEITPDGRILGPQRNRRMLVEGRAQHLIRFPGGRGTTSAEKIARELGVPVFMAPLPANMDLWREVAP